VNRRGRNQKLPWPGWPRPEVVGPRRYDPDVRDEQYQMELWDAERSVQDRMRQRAAAGLPELLPWAIVHCVGGGCSQAPMACVYRTDRGPLYRSELIYAHDQAPWEPTPHLLAVNVNLPPTQSTWLPVAGMDHWSKAGWRPAPPGTPPPPRQYRQQLNALVIRDLLDADTAHHPPLRSKCRKHGEVTLSSDRLRVALTSIPGARSAPYRIPFTAVVA
jgi:hypothetical protein